MAQEIQESRTTTWKNDNPFPQSVLLHNEQGQLRRYTWKPGETKEMDSTFDDAIQTIHGATKNEAGQLVGGVIKGGLAPKLTNMSRQAAERPALDQSLDAEAQVRKLAEARAALAAQNAEFAAGEAIIAQANAEAVKAKPSKKPAEQA